MWSVTDAKLGSSRDSSEIGWTMIESCLELCLPLLLLFKYSGIRMLARDSCAPFPATAAAERAWSAVCPDRACASPLRDLWRLDGAEGGGVLRTRLCGMAALSWSIEVPGMASDKASRDLLEEWELLAEEESERVEGPVWGLGPGETLFFRAEEVWMRRRRRRDGRLAIASVDPSGSWGAAPDWSVKKREAVVVEGKWEVRRAE